MAGTYNTGVFRSSSTAGSDYLVPDEISSQIVQNLPTQSAVLQRAKRVTMSSTTLKMPVLDVLPQAYWVGSDTGLKQTANQAWAGVELVAAELAVIVPIPNAYIDDAQVPIWDEVRPRVGEAIGQKLDQAALFGLGKPASWQSADIYSGAVAAGNVVTEGTGADFAVDVTNAGQVIAADGFAVNGFASRPGLSWKLTGIRSVQGAPIYQPNLSDGDPTQGNLYGYPVSEVNNGAWNATEAELIAGDWNYALCGVRQDITYEMFTEGVISDDSGKVVLNLMQQDAKAMRVVMRVGFATANPVTPLNPTDGTRFPFAVVQTAGASS